MMLQGNRKFITLLVLLVTVAALAFVGKIEGQQALDSMMIIFGTYVVGNVSEHATNAFKDKENREM